MTSDPSTIDVPLTPSASAGSAAPRLVAVLAWVDGAPELAGAVVHVGDTGVVLGRGRGEGDEPRARLVRQLPGKNVPLEPPALPWLSRRHLRLQAMRDGRVLVELLGRGAMRVRDRAATDAMVAAGDVVVLAERAFLLFVPRPETLPAAMTWRGRVQPMGGEDQVGLVGESQVMWALRERIAFVASQAGHALVLGPSGVGKERVARAIHHLSSRGDRPLVARNAATIPPSLVDAELFGHVANYPNPGMRERPGLIGQADGSTLFLDEIGELPEDVQAHLLRVMDGGEYQRLGDATTRVSDLRVVAATNRPAERLKDDLRARCRHVVRVPPLAERREDIPLLLRHLARAALAGDRQLAARFAGEPGALGPEPRIAPALVDRVLGHPLPLQIRELEAILWEAIAASTGEVIACPAGLGAGAGTSTGAGASTSASTSTGASTSASASTGASTSASASKGASTRPAARPGEDEADDPTDLDPEVLRQAIARHGGILERVWRDLGLRNRYVLRRLMARHGIPGPRSDG